jgi:hypothetical protein
VLPGFDSMAVYFGAGARTVPHQHRNGQHLVFVEGVGAVADEDGVHVVPLTSAAVTAAVLCSWP